MCLPVRNYCEKIVGDAAAKVKIVKFVLEEIENFLIITKNVHQNFQHLLQESPEEFWILRSGRRSRVESNLGGKFDREAKLRIQKPLLIVWIQEKFTQRPTIINFEFRFI